MSTVSSINLNLDSLAWCAGVDPRCQRDPTFFAVADRFMALAERYRFRYTIFVIGQDLENPESCARVREWAAAGHEIGNHSYHHHAQLGALPPQQIEYEVLKAHELITRVTGQEPRGFIAPAWSTSAPLMDVLHRAHYLYDTSTFPSVMMWAIQAKLWWNFRHDPRRSSMLRRHDRWLNVWSPTAPHDRAGPSGSLLELPLPVTPTLRIPCWHTAAFVYPRALFERVLRRCLQQKYFYYLVHPADLADVDDLAGTGWQIKNLERLIHSVPFKLSLIERSLDLICAHSQKVTTLGELAAQVAAERGGS